MFSVHIALSVAFAPPAARWPGIPAHGVRSLAARVASPRASAPDSLDSRIVPTTKTLRVTLSPSPTVPPKEVDWWRQWYPLTSTRALRNDQPNSYRLLEKPLVVWKSADGWRVAEDRCPHRGAPLSYGRLESNCELTCSYHGWQFASDGSAAHVPTSHAPGCAACLRVHPTQVCEHGLLWVWPQSCAPGSAEEAAALEKPLPNAHLPPPDCTITDWTVNRVPIPWASLVENTIDDAHGVHAHHGLAGIDRTLAAPALKVRSGQVGDGEAFSTWCNVTYPFTKPSDASPSLHVNSYRFVAPIATTARFGNSYRAEGFIVPGAYDETLLVSAGFSTPSPGLGGRLLVGAQRQNPFLTAVLHRLGTAIACQDAVLAEADGLDDLRDERWTGEQAKGGLTTSDGAVKRVRMWLRRSGGPPLQPAREDVKRWAVRDRLSVWEMHVKHCPTCRRAHDDAAFTAKVLLGFSAAAAASGQLAPALALAATSEASRVTSEWFETFDVNFDNHR